jgi:hypothetical protein
MEDEHLALPGFVARGAGSGAGMSLFGVFDGHGGRHCATFLKSARRPTRVTRGPSLPAAVALRPLGPAGRTLTMRSAGRLRATATASRRSAPSERARGERRGRLARR